MTIKEVIIQLETVNHPVAKTLYKGDNFKILVIGFKSGMKMKDHEAHLHSKLTVISGQVIYREPEKELKLNRFEEVDILINTKHSVEAKEDSLCLLIQG